MGMIELLKEDLSFYEDENQPTSGIEKIEDTSLIKLDPKFLTGLLSFLEKRLPDYSSFNEALGAELLKYVDNSDMDKVRKIKKKIHDIIMKEQIKFFERVRNRVERIDVPKC